MRTRGSRSNRHGSSRVETLVAVAGQRQANLLGHGLVQNRGATQLALALLAHTSRQVTSTSLPMLGLAGTRQSKPLLGSLVSLLLGHNAPQLSMTTDRDKPRILGELTDDCQMERSRNFGSPTLAKKLGVRPE